MSDTLWWTLSLALVLLGLIGTVVPLLPGTVIILVGAVLHQVGLGQNGPGWWTIGGLTLLMLLSQLLDIVSGALGAKWFGATRWGAISGILGAVIGMFFFPLGILIGPLAGALIDELLGGKGLLPAGRSTCGTLLGTTAGLIGKVLIGLLMVIWFLLAVWL